MKLIFLMAAIFLSSVGLGNTTFSNNEIVFPLGREKIKDFLELLKDKENRKVVGIEDGIVDYQDIEGEGSSVFSIGRNSYMLYWADFDNDGKNEYSLIYIKSGSGNYSGLLGSFSLKSRKLRSKRFDEIVVKNLFPGKDMSRFHSFLARTFAVRVKGTTYLRFYDGPKSGKVHAYEWRGMSFKKRNI